MKVDDSVNSVARNLGQQIRAAVHGAQQAAGAPPGHAVRDAVHAVLAANGKGQHVAAPEPAPVPDPVTTDPGSEPGSLLDVSA